MAVIQNKGTNPMGQQVVFPISGALPSTSTPLGSNQPWSTGWMDLAGYTSLKFTFFTDQLGKYVIDYSLDGGTTTIFAPITINLTADTINTLRPGAFDIHARYVRITWTNGPVAQNSFAFVLSARTGNSQESLEAIAALIAPTRLAAIVKAVLEVPDPLGGFGKILRTGDALNVYTTNPPVVATSSTIQEITLATGASNVIAADTSRKGVIINSNSGIVLVGVGFTPTVSKWSFRINTNENKEIIPLWAGLSIGLYSAAGATVDVTLIN